MKRTISGMKGKGSLSHNRREFVAENVDHERSYRNVIYRDENLREVYHELFVSLLHYHLMEDDEYLHEIRQGLEQKLDSLVCHELYAKYKTAPTQEERERARQEYLDRRGVPDSFRW